MNEKPKERGREQYIVAAVAMSSLSNILMSSWIEEHSESDFEELKRAVEMKLKNATIEGINYSQQEALVRRSIIYSEHFLDVFREKMRGKS